MVLANPNHLLSAKTFEYAFLQVLEFMQYIKSASACKLLCHPWLLFLLRVCVHYVRVITLAYN